MTLYTHLQTVNRTVQVAACIGLGLMIAGPAHAAGSGMPWEGPLDQILTSIEEPPPSPSGPSRLLSASASSSGYRALCSGRWGIRQRYSWRGLIRISWPSQAARRATRSI